MHEEALAADLRRKLEELGRSDPALRIVRVRLWVGALSHLAEPALRDLWPRIAGGTRAESARLDVEVSDDPADPRAQGVVLVSIDVE
jgi:hydrogenase nickel incorporation protein HypA/HybF